MRPPLPWKIWLALTLVALCSGITGGAIALRLQNQRMARQTGVFAEALKERLIHRLELTTEQEKEIRPILDRHQERLREVITNAMVQASTVSDELSAEIKPLLRPEQREKLEHLILRRERFREFLHQRWGTNTAEPQGRRSLLRQLWLERIRTYDTNRPAEEERAD